MISRNVILEEEIPYQSLEKIGLSKSSILNLPRPVIDPLISGGVTPLIMSVIKKSDGEEVRVPLKLQLLRDNNGEINVLTYPVRKEIMNDINLSKLELEQLTKGDVIRKEINEYGKRTQRFFQLDNETNSIIQKDATSLRLQERMKEVEKLGDIELGLNQKRAILEGKPVELQTGDTKITVGVDLKQPIGFKNLQGDIKDWYYQKMAEYDRITPGYMAYIQTDANRWEYQEVIKSLQHPTANLSTSKTMKQGL